MIVALLSMLSVPVFSAPGSCKPGMKFIPLLTNLKCTSATASAAACEKCCEKDATTCGGKTVPVVCGAGKYLDPAKAGVTSGAYNAKAQIAACCTDVATCAAATCAAGMKAKTSAADTKCTSNAASCSQSVCCEKDTTKCGGNTVACASTEYQDPIKAGIAGNNIIAQCTSDACWKGVCCTDKATCAAAVGGLTGLCTTGMNAGMKVNTSAASTKCATNSASCAASTCCELDATKCGGRKPKFVCASPKVAKADGTAGTTNAQCCMTPAVQVQVPLATCESFKTGSVTAGAQKTAMNLLFAMAGVVALWK